MEELAKAETFVFKLIQEESFTGLEDERIRNLNPFRDEEGVIRMKSRISSRIDTEDFKFPIILPAWWGGFFERLIDDPSDLTVITPVMFLREQHPMGTPDCDNIDRFSISKRIRNTQRLRDNLRQRFRIEYLGQLGSARGKNSNEIKINELVLIGNDFSKRIDWPLGRVVELIPGRDGGLRFVRVKTTKGVLLRPVQRLFPLECKGPDEEVHGMEQLENKSPPKEEECAGVSKSREIVKLVKVKSAGVPKSRVPVPQVTRSRRVSKIPESYNC
ncbi:hypothetical protein NQ315_002787 [Exocentrus adspersus]|uniref:DUF5641 domain-containing protein n=1 Tax=Exocentrus adspersus TaxID=1586481 RepID=A0AAV8VJZ5_9CUCU|nr:hypothetical protein NQ315_002787 [Exocentrus adspersus]